ncbi:MAG: chemotaxis protein CheA [Candidatus Omnitrophica bacterium]|nr:chemotaxis protein CheA [Candidatus Omnitrophota bacterium]
MDKSYRDLFFAESQEYLRETNKALVQLEKNPNDDEAINTIFRLMHTLKGMAATMRYDDLADLAHALEDVFDGFRRKRLKLTSAVMDVIFESADAFATLTEQIKEDKGVSLKVTDYIKRIKNILPAGETISHQSLKKTSKGKVETGDEVDRLKKLVDKNNNLFSVEMVFNEACSMKGVRAFLVLNRAKDFGQIAGVTPSEDDLKNENFELNFKFVILTDKNEKFVTEELSRILEVDEAKVSVYDPEPSKGKKGANPMLKKIQSMRIPVERLDKIMNLMGELSIAKSRLVQIVQTKDHARLEETTHFLERLVASLQEEALKLRLLPVSFVLDNFPRLIRDLSKKIGKSVDLEISGSEIELDRIILDEVGDPLIHLIRNAIDHGIESPQERTRAGKNPKGKIAIDVSRQKGHIVVEVSDNGKGMDFEKILHQGQERGIISIDETSGIDSDKVLDVLTAPGFSTAKEITDVSGRGVGLDIVRNKLEVIGGRLELESQKGKGTTFILTLPLTLAIIKAMMVVMGKDIYAIPLMNIRETVKVSEDEIKPIKDAEVIRLRDEIIPIVRLGKELEIETTPSEDGQISVVIVEGRVKNMGLVVDKVIGEQDVVVKPLGSFVKKVKGVAGATILGDGRVVLILDIVNVK